MDTYHDPHIQEEMLERYALNQLAEEQLAPLEEHLLGCPICQNRLDEVDHYVLTMKSALSENNHPVTSGKHLNLFQKPGLALIFAGALALMGAFLMFPVRRSHVPGIDIRLSASRGGDSLPIARAHSGAPLILHMDATEIVKAGSYGVEVVDSNGGQVWRGSVRPQVNELSVEVSSELRPGKYWVRLFDSSNAPVLIREYGLELN
jgi:hypothetical protein